MGGIGTFELVLILVIILMIFGAGKLPDVIKMLGSGVKSFRKSMTGQDEEEEEKQEQSKQELLEDSKSSEESLTPERERQADTVQ